MSPEAWIAIAALAIGNGGAVLTFAVRGARRAERAEARLDEGERVFERIESAIDRYVEIERKRHDALDREVAKIHRAVVKVAASLNIDLRE